MKRHLFLLTCAVLGACHTAKEEPKAGRQCDSDDGVLSGYPIRLSPPIIRALAQVAHGEFGPTEASSEDGQE